MFSSNRRLTQWLTGRFRSSYYTVAREGRVSHDVVSWLVSQIGGLSCSGYHRSIDIDRSISSNRLLCSGFSSSIPFQRLTSSSDSCHIWPSYLSEEKGPVMWIIWPWLSQSTCHFMQQVLDFPVYIEFLWVESTGFRVVTSTVSTQPFVKSEKKCGSMLSAENLCLFQYSTNFVFEIRYSIWRWNFSDIVQ